MTGTRGSNKPREEKPGPFGDKRPDAPRPYRGGRAQAESGSLIIQNDHDAWAAASGSHKPERDDTKRLQMRQAWRSIATYGLGDEPGPAAVRYLLLAHAASALGECLDEGNQAEQTALTALAAHARLHARRLQATADQHFLRSRYSRPYQGGRAQAAAGSRIVESDYIRWTQTTASALADAAPALITHAKRLRRAWGEISHRDLADGPAPAAARYHELAEAAAELADHFTSELPCFALKLLLDLAGHARKHSIRLHSTARALGLSDEDNTVESAHHEAAADTAAYQNLPVGIAAVASHAHTDKHRTGETPNPAHRGVHSVRRGPEQQDRARLPEC